jgi:hypothetical protein
MIERDWHGCYKEGWKGVIVDDAFKFDNEEEAHFADNLAIICQSCHAKYHRLGKIPTKEGDV